MFPHRLAVYDNMVYWSDVYFKTLHSANKYTGEGRQTLYENRDAPGSTIYDVKVYDAAQQTCELLFLIKNGLIFWSFVFGRCLILLVLMG